MESPQFFLISSPTHHWHEFPGIVIIYPVFTSFSLEMEFLALSSLATLFNLLLFFLSSWAIESSKSEGGRGEFATITLCNNGSLLLLLLLFIVPWGGSEDRLGNMGKNMKVLSLMYFQQFAPFKLIVISNSVLFHQ